MLKITGARGVVGIDDTRHYHELIAAARQLHIPTVMVQHGHFTKYHVGWLGYQRSSKRGTYLTPDVLLVWSEYWKRELLRLGTIFSENALVVGGYPDRASGQTFAERISERVVLIPHETDSPKNEVSEYVRAFASLPNTVVYLKVRPDIPIAEQLAEYEDTVHAVLRVVSSIREVPEPTLVTGVYSTFLYDMAVRGVPVYLLKTSMDYGEGMVQNGIAGFVSFETLTEVLNEALNRSAAQKISIQDRLTSNKDFEKTLLDVLSARGVL